MSVHQDFTATAGPSVSSPAQTTCGITPCGEVVSYRQVQVQTSSRRNSFDSVVAAANTPAAQNTDVPGSNKDLSAVKPFTPGRSTGESAAPRAESPEVWVDIELQDWPTAAQLADTTASMPTSLSWYSHPTPASQSSTDQSPAPRAESPEVWVDIELQDWPTAAQLADTAASMPSSLPWYSHPIPVQVTVPSPRSCTAQSGAILSKIWGETKNLVSGML